ncbi:hypothetical protein [Niabella aurantiaca]|uniref:hypothetical protein n=1 Tax=Niabella aurantiaca TaxID=379900 RepID=UPI00036EFBD0|nr:hypothetical protein [Niabella aurantiaca]
MKATLKAAPKTNRQQAKMTGRRQNKDDIDSREGEEQLFKGDDVTHNRKEKKHARKQRKT